MKKVEELNEILKKYLGIDFIQGNTEVGQTINEKIDSEKLIRLSMKEIGEKILYKKISNLF